MNCGITRKVTVSIVVCCCCVYLAFAIGTGYSQEKFHSTSPAKAPAEIRQPRPATSPDNWEALKNSHGLLTYTDYNVYYSPLCLSLVRGYPQKLPPLMQYAFGHRFARVITHRIYNSVHHQALTPGPTEYGEVYYNYCTQNTFNFAFSIDEIAAEVKINCVSIIR